MKSSKLLSDFEKVSIKALSLEDIYVFFFTFLFNYLDSGWLSLLSIPMLNKLGRSWIALGGIIGWYLLFNRRKHFDNVIASKAISMVAIYLIVRVFFSLNQGIPPLAIIGTLKFYYIQCLSLFLLIPYISNLTYTRILAIIKLLLYCTIVEFPFYIVQFLGFDFLKTERSLEVGDIELYRSFAIMPQFSLLLPPALFFLFLGIGNTKKIVLFVLFSVLCTLLSLTRGQLASLSITILLVIVVVFIKSKRHRFLEVTIIGIIALVVISVIHPKLLTFWRYYVIETSTNMEKGEAGTLNVRLNLFEAANKSLKQENAWFFGLGYKKDYHEKQVDVNLGIGGRYSVVASADTSIPGIIYTEGYVGLALRYIPAILLVVFALKRLRKESKIEGIILYGSIVTLIIAASFNYVQSSIMRRFLDTLYPIMLLVQLSILYRKDYVIKNICNNRFI